MKRVLIVVAHPDDEVLGCGGTIAKLVDQNCRVKVIFLSDGESSRLNKKSLKKTVEKIFKVNVTKINIINKQNRTKLTRGRKVKVSGFKKAIITLKKGQSIDLTTGI